jgi:hypothetical protein
VLLAKAKAQQQKSLLKNPDNCMQAVAVAAAKVPLPLALAVKAAVAKAAQIPP